MKTTTFLAGFSFATLAFAAPSTSYNKRQTSTLSGDDVKNAIAKWKTDLQAINDLVNIAEEQGSLEDFDFSNRIAILAGSPDMTSIVNDESTQFLTLISLFPQEDDDAKALAKELIPTMTESRLKLIADENNKFAFESNIGAAIDAFKTSRCCGVRPFLKNYWASALEAKSLTLEDAGVSDTDEFGPRSCPPIEECPAQ